MPNLNPPATILVSTAEAAAHLGLTPAGVRSRVRRGALRARHGNSGQLLIEIPADAQSAHDRPEAALPENAGPPGWHGPVSRRPGTPETRGGSSSMPPLVSLAGGVIAGLALAYLSAMFRKAREEPELTPQRR